MNSQKHLRVLSAFAVGFLFAAGLAISGMTQPQKVIGFLQIGRDWDPSLIFVMIGAIGVHAVAYRIVRSRKSPLFDSNFHVPRTQEITKPLIIGSGLFGFGWALGGYCPGPGITSLGAGSQDAAIFVASMVGGMIVQRIYRRYLVKA